MNSTVVFSVIYFLGIGLMLGINELIYRIREVKGEYSRKIAHVMTILATLPLPFIFKFHGDVLILALLFFVILFFTQKSKKLNSVHDIERKSVGSYLLPISIYVVFYIYTQVGMQLVYFLPMVILGVCDPVAALVGMNITKYNRAIPMVGRFLHKSVMGSLGFFFSCYIISCIGLYCYSESFSFKLFGMALVISMAGTIGELFSWNGTDNLTIPVSVVAVLLLLL